MNEAMKYENIQEYFQQIGKEIDQNIVYAYIEPRKRDYLIWGNLVGFKFKYYLAAFYPDEIVLVPLTTMGKFADETITIPKDEINDVRIKKGMMQYKIILFLNDDKLKLKCNKFMLGASWQKENVSYLESVDWFKQELTIF